MTESLYIHVLSSCDFLQCRGEDVENGFPDHCPGIRFVFDVRRIFPKFHQTRQTPFIPKFLDLKINAMPPEVSKEPFWR